MKYVVDTRDSELERIEEDKVIGKGRHIVRYDVLEDSEGDLFKGCYGCGCGCLSVVIGTGLLVGGLYWVLG